jgi:hypothetical protein
MDFEYGVKKLNVRIKKNRAEKEPTYRIFNRRKEKKKEK